MEKNIIGAAFTGNKSIPFFFIEVNNFPNQRFFTSYAPARGFGNSLESVQMSNILFEVKELKGEISGQTQANNAPMPIFTIKYERQERRIDERCRALFQICSRVSL